MRIHVLLVEDNLGDVELVRVHLARAVGLDVEMEVVRTLAAAEGWLAKDRPDVVLADLALPDSEGLATLESLLAAAIGKPVVVLTGSDPELGQAAIAAGAQDFVSKQQVGELLARTLRFAVTRARTQQQLVDYERKLIHSDRLAALGQLAAGVAHEVNNPATYISANLGQMTRIVNELGGSEADERLAALAGLIDECREGFRHVLAITKDLRSFARTSRDEAEVTDLNEAVRAAVNLTRSELRHAARLELDLGDLPTIVAERAKLVQVFVNLLINATQAIAERGGTHHRIAIRSWREGDWMKVAVADDGPGIPPDVLDRIFDPFFTTKGIDQGTGLGLAVCRNCVELHRGRIDVVSTLGDGTIFTVAVPCNTGMVRASTIPPPRPSLAGRRARVLLVDDDRMVRRSLSRLLSVHHDIVEARGGAEAIEMIERDDRIEVIVCDLMMPELDGAAVLTWLEEQSSPLSERIVFVSGGAFTPRGRAVIDAGYRVLDKPIDDTALLGAIHAVVARSKRR